MSLRSMSYGLFAHTYMLILPNFQGDAVGIIVGLANARWVVLTFLVGL